MNLSAIIVSILVLSMFIAKNIRSPRSSQQFSNCIVAIVSILLVFAAAFRAWTVGADTWTYVDDYKSVPRMHFSGMLEQYIDYPGIYILMWIMGKLDLPVVCFFGVVEAIYLLCIYVFIKKFSEDRLFAYFCFFTIGLFFPSMNILKQIISVGLALLSFCGFHDKKYLRSVLCFVLAFLFHQSSLIFLFALFVYYYKNNKELIKIFIIFTLIVAFVGNTLWASVLSWFGNEHYQMYLESDNTYTATTLYYFALIGIIAYLFRKDYHAIQPSLVNVYCVFILMACVLQSFATTYSVSHRLAYFYVPFFIVFVPNCIYFMKNKVRANAIKVVIVAIMSFFCVYTQSKVPFTLLVNF